MLKQIVPWRNSTGTKKMMLYMKLTFAVILIAAMQTLAGVSYSQTTTLSINMKKVPLQAVLLQVEDQSEFYFLYSRTVVDVDRTVDVQFKDARITDVLTVLFRGTDVAYKVDGRQIILSRKSEVDEVEVQQQKTVTGKVTDSSGGVLPGVSVVVKGTNTGNITDAAGNYAISNVPANSVLQFSFVGMKTQEVAVGNKTTINVTLSEDAIGIEEVVAIGYGTQKKVNLTGAVSQITSENFKDRPVTQITQALQGVIPNLNVTFGSGKPGTSGTLNIRGNTSINGGSPLVLVDGIPGTLDRINVNDVESVSVLKDASASAVYGARAAFGVILVTTKKAKAGTLKVTYSTNFGVTTHSTNTDFITSGYWNAKINDDAMYNALGYKATKYSDEDYEELLARVNDKTEDPSRPWVVVKQNSSGKDMYRYYGNFDWFNYFYKEYRPKQDHNVTISGANEKTRYMMSGAYSKETGIFNIRPDEFQRYNMRTKIETDVYKWLTVSNNTHMFKSSYDWFGFSENFKAVSGDVSTYEAGYHYQAAYVPRNPDGTLTGYTGINSYPMGYGLHIALEEGKMKGYSNGTELTTTSEANFKITKAFTVTGSYTYREYRSDYMYRQTKGYYSKFPGVMELHSQSALKTDMLSESMSKYNWGIINVYGNYETTFGKHGFKAMAGYNQENRTYKRIGGTGQELLSETLNDLNLVTGEELVSGGADEWALRGGFYRLNYDYAGKYLFEASGRYDGTSRFPKSSRFGYFPSFSTGWRVSEEGFFSPLKHVVDNLKLRASYGTLGNQEVGTYAYISSMNTGQISYLVDNSKLNATYNPAPVAPTLTWESTTTKNIGLDADFFANRLSFSGDYYIRDTKDMLTQGKVLPSVFGANEPEENAADLRTKGFELTVSWRDKFELFRKQFSYSISGVLSDYTSKITKFDNPTRLLSSYYEGQQLGEIWGYIYDGFFKTTEEAQEWAAKVNQDKINKRRVSAPTADLKKLQAGDIKILDLDNDGIIYTGANTVDDPGDRRIIGNSQPRYSYGVTLSAQWNGFDFSALFQGIGKQNWYPDKESQKFWQVYARPYGSFIPKDFLSQIWSPENPDAYFPFLRAYTAQNSELSVNNNMYLQDLAYCKLRNLTLGYSLPANLLNKVSVDRIRIYVSGENLFTWTKLDTDYIDPEEVMSDKTGRTYPIGKTFSVGAEITF